MSKLNIALVVAIGVALTAGHPKAQAQTQPPAGRPVPNRSSTPLRVVIAISTFQGEKKVSSLPYTLSVNAGEPPFTGKPSRVQMGAEVPVTAMKEPTVDGKPISEARPGVPAGGGPVTYKAIGTNIDCSAVTIGDGRFALTISVEDSSIVSDPSSKGPAKAGEPPIFRSFRLSNEVVLRDGQSTQFTSATDRISGDSIRVDVTLTVIK